MNLFVLNENYQKEAYLDSYSSLQWNSKYYECGDFVLVTPATADAINTLMIGKYIQRADTGQLGIIEGINVKQTADADTFTVTGRAIESILARRIIWTQTSSKSSETAEDYIRRLITENAVSPADSARKIPGLILGEKQGFTEKIDMQFTGDNLLDAIIAICKTYSYGFKIVLTEQNEMAFQIYRGTDRSYSQSTNPYVVFSDNFDNLSETEYSADVSTYRNVALIGGEGEGTERRYQSTGTASGLDRYELFVDAKDISSNKDSEEAISDEEYNAMLIDRGIEKLAENSVVEDYDGLIDMANSYRYGQDYFLGDVVQVEDSLGITASPRIVAMLESMDENGYQVVPTFETWRMN